MTRAALRVSAPRSCWIGERGSFSRILNAANALERLTSDVWPGRFAPERENVPPTPPEPLRGGLSSGRLRESLSLRVPGVRGTVGRGGGVCICGSFVSSPALATGGPRPTVHGVHMAGGKKPSGR
eukprot:891358-Prymnesium_polylepis.1